MYKIIGTDHKEYGPVSSDQIQQWIAQGRISAQTKAQADGGDWKTLGEFPEFTAALSKSVPPVPRPAPYPPATPAQPVKTSGMAIASLVLGLLGIVSCGITALIGLILGIVAMNQVRKSNGTVGGHGIALAGTIVSAVFLLFMIPVGAAMLLPALANAKQKAQLFQCVNNAKQLCLGAEMYANDHQDKFPPAATWCDALKTYVGSEKVFRCPAANPGDRCDYAFNSKLSGMAPKNINPHTVLIFETNDGWNQNGGPELMRQIPRHKRLFVVGFVDGHMEQVSSERLAGLRWDP
jgi:hypothetical protein